MSNAVLDQEKLRLLFGINYCVGMVAVLEQTINAIGGCGAAAKVAIPDSVRAATANELRGLTTDQKCAVYRATIEEFKRKLNDARQIHETGIMRKQDANTYEYHNVLMTPKDVRAYTDELNIRTRTQIDEVLKVLEENINETCASGRGGCALY